MIDDHDMAQAQAQLGQVGWMGYFTPAGTGPGGGPSGGVGWVWQEWLPVGQVGAYSAAGRIVSIDLASPVLGPVTLASIYGWTGDHQKTMALVEKGTRGLAASAKPWAIVGHFNIPSEVFAREVRVT